LQSHSNFRTTSTIGWPTLSVSHLKIKNNKIVYRKFDFVSTAKEFMKTIQGQIKQINQCQGTKAGGIFVCEECFEIRAMGSMLAVVPFGCRHQVPDRQQKRLD